MTICNAFKVAHYLQDAAFVKYTEEKLWQKPEAIDWNVISLLLSTLNLINDKSVLESNQYDSLWQAISASTVSLFRNIHAKPVNLRTLLMMTRLFVKKGNVTFERNPELWDEICCQIVTRCDRYCQESS